MSISKETITQIAQKFLATEAQHAPIEPVAKFYQGITPAEAYRVQQAVLTGLAGQGHKIVGKKVGASSAAAQSALGVSEPLYGILLDTYRVEYGQPVSTRRLINPRLECEITFIMDKPLAGPNLSADDVLAATQAVAASFEIVDFRATGWQPGPGEAISYNVFASGFMLGQKRAPVSQVDLPGVRLTLKKNGEKVAEATGEAVLGNPAKSVAWLANKLAENGLTIGAGEIVLSGAIAAPHPIEAGDHFEAVFDPLETISIRFS